MSDSKLNGPEISFETDRDQPKPLTHAEILSIVTGDVSVQEGIARVTEQVVRLIVPDEGLLKECTFDTFNSILYSRQNKAREDLKYEDKFGVKTFSFLASRILAKYAEGHIAETSSSLEEVLVSMQRNENYNLRTTDRFGEKAAIALLLITNQVRTEILKNSCDIEDQSIIDSINELVLDCISVLYFINTTYIATGVTRNFDVAKRRRLGATYYSGLSVYEYAIRSKLKDVLEGKLSIQVYQQYRNNVNSIEKDFVRAVEARGEI